jgi:hypothetical protein
MGCDIHSFAERKTENGYELIEGVNPFDWRAYGMYGFLAGVRNYSDVPPLAQPRGFPDDASAATKAKYEEWGRDAHTPSWLSVDELSAFNYDAEMEDRRVTRQLAPNYFHGGCTAEPGGGETMTYREFLGTEFFRDLEELRADGADRIVFWFDN